MSKYLSMHPLIMLLVSWTAFPFQYLNSLQCTANFFCEMFDIEGLFCFSLKSILTYEWSTSHYCTAGYVTGKIKSKSINTDSIVREKNRALFSSTQAFNSLGFLLYLQFIFFPSPPLPSPPPPFSRVPIKTSPSPCETQGVWTLCSLLCVCSFEGIILQGLVWSHDGNGL